MCLTYEEQIERSLEKVKTSRAVYRRALFKMCTRYTVAEIAVKVGKSQAWVKRMLGKARWRTKSNVCCHYILLHDTISHEQGCPNRGSECVKPCYRVGSKWVRK